MEAENFAGCNSAEIHEVDLKSYPGERALGVYFCMVISPSDYDDFYSELQTVLDKYAL